MWRQGTTCELVSSWGDCKFRGSRHGRRWVVANRVPKLESDRITFTFPLINAAKAVAFLIRGENKRPVMRSILAGTEDLPAGHVRSRELHWLTGKG